jgi:hypothetical protein
VARAARRAGKVNEANSKVTPGRTKEVLPAST